MADNISSNKNKMSFWQIAPFIFVGCIIVGSGIGQLVGHVGSLSTLGVGVGFLLIAILALVRK